VSRLRIAPLLVAFFLLPSPQLDLAIAQESAKSPNGGPTASGKPASATAQTGTLKARFRYMGRPPEPKAIEVNKDVGILGQYDIVDQSLAVSEDRGVANVIVWVRNKDIPAPPAENLKPVTIEFKEGQFFPHVLAFQAPREVVGKLNESLTMNFNYSGNVSVFNILCLAHSEISARVEPELTPVRLFDNHHPWAIAWVLPLTHPYCAVSDNNGYFKIENLPPGKWEFQVWQERTGYLQTKDWPKGRFTMEIKPGENDLGEIKLPPVLFHDAAHPDEP
jgi:hypothetical protein